MKQQPPPPEPRSRALPVAMKVLRVIPPLLLVGWVAFTGPWSQIAERLRQADWVPFALALAVNFLVFQPIRALRWRSAMQTTPPFLTILAATIEGSAAGAVLGTAVGDVVRSARLGRPGTFANDLGSSIADRACEYLALTILLGTTAVSGVVPLPWVVAPLIFALVLGAISRWHGLLEPHLVRWPQVQKGFTGMISALTARRMSKMVLLAFAGWASEMVMLYLVLRTLGMPSGLDVAVMIVISINVATAIPGIPANLGTFEAGVVFALEHFAVGQSAALSFALIYHGLHLGPTVLVGGTSWTLRSLVMRRRNSETSPN